MKRHTFSIIPVQYDADKKPIMYEVVRDDGMMYARARSWERASAVCVALNHEEERRP